MSCPAVAAMRVFPLSSSTNDLPRTRHTSSDPMGYPASNESSRFDMRPSSQTRSRWTSASRHGWCSSNRRSISSATESPSTEAPPSPVVEGPVSSFVVIVFVPPVRQICLAVPSEPSPDRTAPNALATAAHPLTNNPAPTAS